MSRLSWSERLAIVVLLVAAATMWQGYDVHVFRNWVIASLELGLARIYLAPLLLGWSYRVVYPPLAPAIFVASYLASYHLYQTLQYISSVNSMAALIVQQYADLIIRIIVKAPLIVALMALWLMIRRRYGRRAGILLLLGPPTLAVIGPYNFDIFMGVLLFLAVYMAYEKRSILSGASAALSALFKQSAVLALPHLVSYYALRNGARSAIKWLVGLIVTSIIVLMPFILYSHIGSMINCIAGFHASRLPQGPSIWSLTLLLTGYNIAYSLTVSKAWLIIFITIYALTLAPIVIERSRLVRIEYVVALSLLAYLVAGKVINPAYLFWAYPFIICIAFERRDQKLLKTYLVASLIPLLFFSLYYLSVIAAHSQLFIEEEVRWYPYTKALQLIRESLTPPLAYATIRLIELKPISIVLTVVNKYWVIVGSLLSILYTILISYCFIRVYKLGFSKPANSNTLKYVSPIV